MEALWNIEDKWKLTTQKAVLLLGCTSFLVILLCTATILKKAQRKQATNQIEATSGSIRGKWCDSGCDWRVSVKRMLMGSVRWSRASKWRDRSIGGGWRERMSPLLGSRGGCEKGGVGWRQSHNLGSPVWQRPILMGEKCELPRFSGLILYDGAGRLVEHSLKEAASHKNDIHKEKPAAVVVRTTLKDLL